MNDAELENHLRDLLRPAAPSAGLRGRIYDRLNPPPARAYAGRIERARRGFFQVLLRDFGWATAGAAAAVAVLAVLPAKQTPLPASPATTGSVATSPATTTTDNTFEHDETTHELVAAQGSEQLVETEDGPAREVHYTYVERHEWSNPHTGARVYLEVPREDVYLLPVSLQ